MTNAVLDATTDPRTAYLKGQARLAAERYGVDPNIYDRLINQESGYASDVIDGTRASSAGALGIAQFMPDTAKGLGIDPLNPMEALDAGAKYVSDHLKQFSGDYRAALAAYNAGAGTVGSLQQHYGADWEQYLPAETKQYLAAILGDNLSPALGNAQGSASSGPGLSLSATPASRLLSPQGSASSTTDTPFDSLSDTGRRQVLANVNRIEDTQGNFNPPANLRETARIQDYANRRTSVPTSEYVKAGVGTGAALVGGAAGTELGGGLNAGLKLATKIPEGLPFAGGSPLAGLETAAVGQGIGQLGSSVLNENLPQTDNPTLSEVRKLAVASPYFATAALSGGGGLPVKVARTLADIALVTKGGELGAQGGAALGEKTGIPYAGKVGGTVGGILGGVALPLAAHVATGGLKAGIRGAVKSAVAGGETPTLGDAEIRQINKLTGVGLGVLRSGSPAQIIADRIAEAQSRQQWARAIVSKGRTSDNAGIFDEAQSTSRAAGYQLTALRKAQAIAGVVEPTSAPAFPPGAAPKTPVDTTVPIPQPSVSAPPAAPGADLAASLGQSTTQTLAVEARNILNRMNGADLREAAKISGVEPVEPIVKAANRASTIEQILNKEGFSGSQATRDLNDQGAFNPQAQTQETLPPATGNLRQDLQNAVAAAGQNSAPTAPGATAPSPAVPATSSAPPATPATVVPPSAGFRPGVAGGAQGTPAAPPVPTAPPTSPVQPPAAAPRRPGIAGGVAPAQPVVPPPAAPPAAAPRRPGIAGGVAPAQPVVPPPAAPPAGQPPAVPPVAPPAGGGAGAVPPTTPPTPPNTGGNAFWRTVVGIAGVPQSLAASFDVSNIGRQGEMLGLSHPKIWGEMGRDTFKSLGSEQFTQATEQALAARPLAWLGDLAKLHFYDASPNAPASARVPGYTGVNNSLPARVVGKITQPFERAFATGLNVQGASVFDQYAQAMLTAGVDPHTPAGLRRFTSLANVINHARGYGSFNPGDISGPAGETFNAFFSGRNMVSRAELITDMFTNWRNPEALKLAWKNMGAFAGANASMMYMLGAVGAHTGLWSVEADPRSSDFGKLKIGNSRYDTLAGLGPLIKVVARVATGQTKTAQGNIDPSHWQQEIIRFFANKESPVARLLAESMGQPGVDGQPVKMTPLHIASIFIPLIGGDTWDAFKQSGGGVAGGALAAGTAVASAVGIGAQSYTSSADLGKNEVSQFVQQGGPQTYIDAGGTVHPVQTYADLKAASPLAADAFDKQHPELVQQRQATLGPVQQKAAGIEATHQQRQQERDTALKAQTITPDQWRAESGDDSTRTASELHGLYESQGDYTGEPHTLLALATKQFNDAITANTKGSKTDWNAVDAVVAKMPPAAQRLLQENRLKGETPLRQEYINLLAKLDPYFKARDAAWQAIATKDPELAQYKSIDDYKTAVYRQYYQQLGSDVIASQIANRVTSGYYRLIGLQAGEGNLTEADAREADKFGLSVPAQFKGATLQPPTVAGVR